MTQTESIPVLRDVEIAPDALRQRVVLVTGASRGIGRAVALEAAGAGARVILSARDSKALEKVDDEIRAAGCLEPGILPLNLLKATVDDYRAAASAIRENYGRLDGFAHLAAVLGEMSSIEHYPPMTWHNVMHVNASATFLLTQALLPLLGEAPDGAIVYATSSVGRRGRAHWGAYAVSKFALEGLMQTLADECDGRPRVNCLNPGATRTAMRRSAYPAEDPTRLATPEQIAPAFVHLLVPGTTDNGRTFDAQG